MQDIEVVIERHEQRIIIIIIINIKIITIAIIIVRLCDIFTLLLDNLP